MGKMLKAFLLLIITCFVLNQKGYAAPGPFTKLGRGLTNIVTSPGELIYQPAQLSEDNNLWIAWLGGFPKGLVFIPIRILVGVYDVVTFPIPYPNHYGPILRPETLIEGYTQ